MSTKRIIGLGSGFSRAKQAEALRDELPLGQADVVQFRRETPSRLQPATGGNHRFHIEPARFSRHALLAYADKTFQFERCWSQ
jgi:hypothetical protein